LIYSPGPMRLETEVISPVNCGMRQEENFMQRMV